MNKLEDSYRQYLENEMRVGRVEWYLYEGIKFKLADKTFYTPDFAVMKAGGEMEVHEVKGFMMDDANVKLKCAAERFPFKFLLIKKAKGGSWDIKEV
jgi:hypothetical protein